MDLEGELRDHQRNSESTVTHRSPIILLTGGAY